MSYKVDMQCASLWAAVENNIGNAAVAVKYEGSWKLVCVCFCFKQAEVLYLLPLCWAWPATSASKVLLELLLLRSSVFLLIFCLFVCNTTIRAWCWKFVFWDICIVQCLTHDLVTHTDPQCIKYRLQPTRSTAPSIMQSVSVCENQIQSKLSQFVHNSMEEIDSHNRMLRES